jgi:peptidoglycan/LPS O-acetylase OafA/YrhL
MTSRNQALDVLRGIAVLMVIVSHYSEVMPYGISYHLLWIAGTGVDLFFVLSGFLISGLLFAEFKRTGSIHVSRFWIRRGFKIYPPFYVFFAATAIAALVRTERLPRELLGEAVFLQNYWTHFWPHTWSLAVEEHFYFALPLFLFLLIKLSRSQNPFRAIPIISVVICALCLWLRILAFRQYHDWAHMAFPSHLRIDALFVGVTLGYFAHFDQDSFREGRRHWVLVVGLLFASSLLVIPDLPRLTFSYVAFCFIVAWAVNQPAPRSPIWRPLSLIGYYSYSIYLWHVGAMLLLKVLPTRWYRFPVYFSIAVGFGILMSRLIEVPTLRARDKLFPSLQTGSLVTAQGAATGEPVLPASARLEPIS